MAVSIANRLSHPSLLVLLADGRLHSGEWLASQLDMSRAAVWKGVQRLRGMGLDVVVQPRRGYRLSEPVELLDAQRIGAQIAPERSRLLRKLELLFEVDSTNTRLLGNPAPPPGSADACFSEIQHAGRGRRGRRWIAPFGSGVALSVAWSFGEGARALPALSLAVGVAVARAAQRAGARGVTLKWPNDIWFAERKIGGVLVELRAEASGPAHVVIGVGVNAALPAAARREIEAGGACVAAVADACDAGTIRARGLRRVPGRLGGSGFAARQARSRAAGGCGYRGYGAGCGPGRGVAARDRARNTTFRVWRGQFARGGG